jgi:hypothetical protein
VVRVHDRRDGCADADGVTHRRDRQGRLHPRAQGVTDNPVGVHILDRTEVKLALIGAMFGDVGQPDLVGGLSAEPAVEKVVVDRGSGLSVQAPLLGEDRPDPFLSAQPSDLFSPALIPPRGSSSAMKRYPNAGSSAWMSRASLIRCVSSQSRCVKGVLRHL